MNWYFEIDGVSKGPFPEDEFVHMVRRNEVPAESLVWKPDMEEWATIREINPPWLSATAPVSVSASASTLISKVEPQRKPGPSQTAASIAPKNARPTEQDLPVIEAAIPTESAAPTPAQRAPATSKLKLQAPTPPPPQPAPPQEKGGLLKRVFGFGGKKK